MTYAIVDCDGNPIPQARYKTHQEALWHLMNDEGYGDSPEERRRAFHIIEVSDYQDCPKCGAKNQMWEGDSYVCDNCFHCWE